MLKKSLMSLMIGMFGMVLMLSSCAQHSFVGLNDSISGAGGKSSAKEIITFSVAIDGADMAGEITGSNIIVTVPADANVTALVPTITISDKASVSPESGVAQDFTIPYVLYTVTAEDGSTKYYIATVVPRAAGSKSSAKDITVFTIPSQVGETVITGTEIAVTVPYGADITNLTPTIEVSEDASVIPESGDTQNFTHSVTYIVTAEDGTVKVYTVKVTVEPPPPPPPPTCTVTYDGNGNTGGTVPTDGNSYVLDVDAITVIGNTGGLVKGSLLKDSYSFAGWTLMIPDGGKAGPYLEGDQFFCDEFGMYVLSANWTL